MHGVPDRVLLRHLLAKAGGSRREAPRRAGVGRSTMYRWLEGGLLDEPHNVSVDMLERIAKGLKTDVGQLMTVAERERRAPQPRS